MIHPIEVNVTQKDRTLYLLELFLANKLYLGIVKLHCSRKKKLCDILFLYFLATLKFFEILVRSEQSLVGLAKSCEIPKRTVIAAEISRHVFIYGGLYHLLYRSAYVLTVKNAVSLSVNHVSLLIHYVIVGKNVFASLKVLILYSLLRVFYLVRQYFCINRHILGKSESVYYPNHFFRAEQTHKIVLESNIEFGFSRVALTSRSSAQLIINTSAFVAFCSKDKQTARFFYLLRFGSYLCLEFCVKLTVYFPCVVYLLVVDLSTACCHSDKLLAYLHLAHLSLGKKFGVAAKHNVGSSSRHICRNSYSAKLSRLSNYLCFLIMMLCVKNSMRYTLSLKS